MAAQAKAALPSVIDEASLMRPDPNLVCPICLDVFNVPVRTQCGHIFCSSCITNWMQDKASWRVYKNL